MSTFLRPLVRIAIDGEVLKSAPTRFYLRTDIDEPSVASELTFSNPVPSINVGAVIAITMVRDDTEARLFTGTLVRSVPSHARRLFIATDDAAKLRRTTVQLAYRDEQDQVIVKDILEQAGVDSFKIATPGIQFDRFSTPVITADRALAILIESFGNYGVDEAYRYFFDTGNTFRFGTFDDANNGIDPIALSSRTDVIDQSGDWITILPRAIRHSQTVIIDGAKRRVVRSELSIRPKRSRLVLTLGALP